MKRIILFLLLITGSQSFGQVLSGTYYIPKQTNQSGFSTLAQAFNAVNANGCSGEVVFLIQSNLQEIGDSLMLERSDLNSNNRLIIKPAPNKLPKISISGCASSIYAISRYSGLTLNNTSCVTIDGSNTEGGTTKDLTIYLEDITNGRIVIQLYGNCDNVIIKNVTLQYKKSPTGNYGIIQINGRDTGVSDDMIINNCYVGDAFGYAYYGVKLDAAPSGSIFSNGFTIDNCRIFSKFNGIALNNIGSDSSETTIRNNFIKLIGDMSKDNNTILINNWGGTINIINNTLQDVIRPENFRNFSTISTIGGKSNAVCNIYNNFIGGVKKSNSGNANVITMFNINGNAKYNIFNNSINRTMVDFYEEYSCLHLDGQNAIVYFKNNIVLNNGTSGKGVNTCFNVLNGTLISDYNNIYITDSIYVSIGYYNNTYYNTLSSWKAATNLDSHSISKKTNFVSVLDMHLTKGSIGDFSIAGTYLPEVTIDIDGESRVGKRYPYMGADESEFIPLQPYSKNIDADTSDWIGQKSSIVHATSFDEYETIYTGEKDDARTDQSLGSLNPFKNNDLTEVRTLLDSNYMYFLFRFNDLLDINNTYIAMTFDYDMADNEPVWIGDDSPVVLNPSINRGWEKQLAFHCTTTNNMDIELSSGVVFSELISNYAVSYDLDNDVVEARVSLYDLGMQPGNNFVTTISTFHNNVLLARVGDATYKSYIDAVTPGYNGSSNVFYRVGGHEYFNANVDWANSGTIPVELESFEVEKIDSHIQIAWTTVTETNCNLFEIQKSIDKVSWEQLGTVKGMGTSTEPHKYLIKDLSPNNGHNYYKLLQVDYDGTISCLGIKDIYFTEVYTYALSQNYPNPFNPSTTIKFAIPQNEVVTLKVYDVLGKEVTTLINEELNAGSHTKIWEAKNLSSGVYFYKLQAGKFTETKKMILVR